MSEMTVAMLLLGLRILVVAGLYGFLLLVFRALRAELAAASHAPGAAAYHSDLLEVIACDDAPALLGKVYPLDAVTSLGRDSDNTVILPDPRISAKHAQMVWRGGHWWVEDLGSTNGTFVNGQPVTQPTRLGARDLLRVGPAALRVRSA